MLVIQARLEAEREHQERLAATDKAFDAKIKAYTEVLLLHMQPGDVVPVTFKCVAYVVTCDVREISTRYPGSHSAITCKRRLAALYEYLIGEHDANIS